MKTNTPRQQQICPECKTEFTPHHGSQVFCTRQCGLNARGRGYYRKRCKPSRDPKGHMCDCGNDAAKKKGCDWVCARCDEIESGLHRRANHAPVETRRVTLYDRDEITKTQEMIDRGFRHFMRVRGLADREFFGRMV